MRPKIIPSRSIARSLMYNEEKVTLRQAEYLVAGNFLKDLSRLSPEDKLHCFQRRMELNDRVVTNQHIMLNFDPLDKLSNDQMKKIAQLYMKEIGFGRQPYIVYRHYDAGHPHCHIVTTHVCSNGDPIKLYNIGRNQSEKARLRIEAEFGLVTTEMKQQLRLQEQKIDGVQRIKYGEGSLSRSISRVLEYVTKDFKLTSLTDLNAVLRLYNVEAYRGKESSQLYQHRGLLYRALDENGKYIGVPLKASFFDCKPTLDNLETKFRQNQSLKQQCKERMIIYTRYGLYGKPQDLKKVRHSLTREQIHLLLRRDKEGNAREVFYIDFRNKCVFTGDELGEHCNVVAIQKVIDRQRQLEKEQTLQQNLNKSLKQTPGYRHSLHL
ncbi:MAG TPA: relaxase/mobilization nuclease domain-containing protein [Puia sp.]|jgi:hypothetical protein